MAEKIYLHGSSIEQAVDRMMSDYRSGDLDSAVIAWTNKGSHQFSYDWVAKTSCFHLLGIMTFLIDEILGYVKNFPERRR